jgi:serine/threonine-protein kinase
MVLVIALIVLLEHVTVFVLAWHDQPHWTIQAARWSQFVLIGLVFWHNRGSRLLPTSAAERELWTIWLGYLAAYMVNTLVVRLMIGSELIVRGPGAPAAWEDLVLYPFSAVLSGLAFFIMGANYWGRCYAVGLFFFGLALLITRYLDFAPLAFGLLWSITLAGLGLRLRRLGIKAEEEKGKQKAV